MTDRDSDWRFALCSARRSRRIGRWIGTSCNQSTDGSEPFNLVLFAGCAEKKSSLRGDDFEGVAALVESIGSSRGRRRVTA